MLWTCLRRAGRSGKPANTKVGITIDTDWFWGLVEECVRGYIKTH
ncbi:hypothetical protein ACLB1S_20155 [Escherichia coli]